MHDGTTPLILAARLAVEGMVDELINCHADANAIDDFGRLQADHTVTRALQNKCRNLYYSIIAPTLHAPTDVCVAKG
jgi:hypothetical protein